MDKVTFEVIVGSYEEFLIGYKFSAKDESLSQSFATHSHNSSVRCVTHSGTYLASGGADDRIVIYDLHLRNEHCMLTHHTGTVNCLRFTNGHTHLISGSSDGVLAIVRLGNWQLEKIWDKAHKGAAILDIAVHESGKLALTLGTDSTLRTWNLIKGRQAYAINLNSKSKNAKSLHTIKWAPDGVHFVLAGGNYTEVWSINSGGIVRSIEHESKVTSVLWVSDDVLLTGYEDGKLCKFGVNDVELNAIQAHDGRIKDMNSFDKYIVTCSSNGEIKVWSKELKEIAKCSTGCRITCICVVSTGDVKSSEEMQSEEHVATRSLKRKKKSSEFIT